MAGAQRYAKINGPTPGELVAKLSRLVLVSVLILVAAWSRVKGQVTAVAAGTLLDPETGIETHNQIILIEGGKIKEIGPSVSVPEGAIRIDLSHQTVLPGLIDAHTHLLANVDPKWDLGDFWIMALQRRPGWRAIPSNANLRRNGGTDCSFVN